MMICHKTCSDLFHIIQFNLVRQIYCTFSMGKSLLICTDDFTLMHMDKIHLFTLYMLDLCTSLLQNLFNSLLFYTYISNVEIIR